MRGSRCCRSTPRWPRRDTPGHGNCRASSLCMRQLVAVAAKTAQVPRLLGCRGQGLLRRRAWSGPVRCDHAGLLLSPGRVRASASHPGSGARWLGLGATLGSRWSRVARCSARIRPGPADRAARPRHPVLPADRISARSVEARGHGPDADGGDERLGLGIGPDPIYRQTIEWRRRSVLGPSIVPNDKAVTARPPR